MHADALILFGITGDLARRRLFPALYALAEQNRLSIPVIGVSRAKEDSESLRRGPGRRSPSRGSRSAMRCSTGLVCTSATCRGLPGSRHLRGDQGKGRQTSLHRVVSGDPAGALR